MLDAPTPIYCSLRPKIAIIEDDQFIRELIRHSVLGFVDSDAEVLFFDETQDSIYGIWGERPGSVPEETPVNLMFLDINLERGSNGFDVAEFCQFIPEKLPIVLMSSSFSETDQRRVASLNLDIRFLQKPFGAADIISVSRDCLKKAA